MSQTPTPSRQQLHERTQYRRSEAVGAGRVLGALYRLCLTNPDPALALACDEAAAVAAALTAEADALQATLLATYPACYTHLAALTA